MKRIIIILMMLSISHSAFAQYDSTNLPGISANVAFVQQPGNVRLPDTLVLDQATQYTETAVLACPSGYYANGAVPTDGSSTTSQVSGGVIEERSVTTDRFGTTSYGAWTQVNFLCTAIPPAPTCASGYTQTSAPYWDSNTNQWVGLQCVQTQKTLCNYGSGTAFEFIKANSGAMWWRVEWNNVEYGSPSGSPIYLTGPYASNTGDAASASSWDDAVNQAMKYGMYPQNTTPQSSIYFRGAQQTTYTYSVCNNGSVIPNN